jgi:hypothetical protein
MLTKLLTKRRSFRSNLLRAATEPASDESFPRAVPGEDYDRYARAMAKHADQWLVAHLDRLSGVAIEAHELRERLRLAAVAEMRRELNAQEERLLSDVLQRRPDAGQPSDRVEPEIPSFLLRRIAS